MVVHAFNPSADEADGGTSLWVWSQPALHNKLQTSQVRPWLKIHSKKGGWSKLHKCEGLSSDLQNPHKAGYTSLCL